MYGEKRQASPAKTSRNLRSKGDSCRICQNNTVLGQSKDSMETAVLCGSCKFAFHLNCAGISDTFFLYYIKNKNQPWHCYACDCKLRNEMLTSNDAIKNIETVAQSVNKEVQLISQEVSRLKESGNSWRQEVEMKLMDSIDRKVESAISAQLSHLSRNGDQANSSASSTTPSHSYRKNVIITCVPEADNENVLQIVKSIAKQINFTISNFIDNCFRVEKKAIREGQQSPAAIFLKFSTELSRDHFMRCYFNYIKKNPLTPDSIGMAGSNRIYINEHLHPALQPLFRKALELRNKKCFLKVVSHSTFLSVQLNVDNRPVWRRVSNEETLMSLIQSDEVL